MLPFPPLLLLMAGLQAQPSATSDSTGTVDASRRPRGARAISWRKPVPTLAFEPSPPVTPVQRQSKRMSWNLPWFAIEQPPPVCWDYPWALVFRAEQRHSCLRSGTRRLSVCTLRTTFEARQRRPSVPRYTTATHLGLSPPRGVILLPRHVPSSAGGHRQTPLRPLGAPRS
jgi:hypothetical protein